MKLNKTLICSSVCAAALSLQGCVVANDPYTNGVATGALTTAAVGLLFYSAHDGYYYDHYYNRMPRNYRPPRHIQVRRIDNMNHYRMQHPIHRPGVVHHQQRMHPAAGYYPDSHRIGTRQMHQQRQLHLQQRQIDHQQHQIHQQQRQINHQQHQMHQQQRQMHLQQRQIDRQDRQMRQHQRQQLRMQGGQGMQQRPQFGRSDWRMNRMR